MPHKDMKSTMPSKFDPQRYHRRSIRLQGYDYTSSGVYFITIVTYQRECLFGEINDGEMTLSKYGKIANECWQSIPEHFPNVELGTHMVMPNHVHGIIVIHDQNHRTAVYPPSVRGAACCAPTRCNKCKTRFGRCDCPFIQIGGNETDSRIGY